MSHRPHLDADLILNSAERTILLTQGLEARSMHQVWLLRARAFLEGKAIDFPREFAMREDMCPIGTWLRERIDPRLKSLELYTRTSDLHNEFHLALGRLVTEDIARFSSGARAEFMRTGDGLTGCIEEWVALARNEAR